MSRRPKSANSITQAIKVQSRGRRQAFSDEAQSTFDDRPRRDDLLPHLELVHRRPDELIEARRKVRKSTAAQQARLRATISTLGFRVPILISRDGEIIDGHERVAVAQQLGLEKIPCIVSEDLTPEEVRVLRLSVNRIAERGEWDMDALKIEFGELIELGASIEVSGFDLPEIDAIVLGEAVQTEQGPLEPDPELPRICQPGDIWRLGKHLAACGDARDPQVYAALMQGRQARLVFTDEPFNVPIAGHVSSSGHREFVMAAGEMSTQEFADFNTAWIAASAAHLMPGGLLASFIDWRSVELLLAAGREAGLTLLNIIIWCKTNASMGSLWRSQHEMLPVFKRPGAPHVNNVELGRHGRWRGNTWTYPGASSMGSDSRKGLALHPTVKPVEMLKDALLDVTHIGDIVLEPFAGSFSTLMACEQTGRLCRAIELDPLYMDVGLRRWFAATGQEPVLIHRGDAGPFDRNAAAEPEPLRLAKPRLRVAAVSSRGQ